MALPALSNAALFDAQPEAQPGWGGWAPNDRTRFGEVVEKRREVSPYYKDAMAWGKEPQTVTGVDTISTVIDPREAGDDEDAYDRVFLLSKKYATETLSLSKEDGARLEILNQSMDLKHPRYTEKDWAALEEAEKLLAELEKIKGE